MPIDIDNLNPGTRFFYPDDPDGKEWVSFRLPTAEVQKQIDAATLETVTEMVHPKKKNGKPDRRRPPQRINYDQTIPGKEQEREALTIDHCIVTWNLETPDGDAIPCNAETKVKLVQGSFEFNAWMNECLETLIDSERKAKKDQEKN